MGISSGIAINEGVALLDKLAPAHLTSLRTTFPELAGKLVLGIDAGDDEENQPASTLDPLITEKAKFMIATLGESAKASENALVSVTRRIHFARRQRLLSQALVLIGSSSSLATLALSNNRAAIIAAVLTLLAALGNLAAEYQEQLLNPQSGNIYDVFQTLSSGAYKARTLSTELTLALKYAKATEELTTLVTNANALCEQLNSGLIQLLSKVPS